VPLTLVPALAPHVPPCTGLVVGLCIHERARGSHAATGRAITAAKPPNIPRTLYA
jgi:hypothetical protein